VGCAFRGLRIIASVGHLDRALGFEPRGREFESLRTHQSYQGFPVNRREQFSPFCFRGTFAGGNVPNEITNQDQQHALSRIKWISTLLLVAVAILYVIARWREHKHAAWPVVVAFSEAAVVGALADWFAVVALFRHPMGIPLPHTAIIPRSKQRIADKLAAFIIMNFLGTEAILLRIRSFNPAAKLAAWLSKPESAEVLGNYGIRAISYGLRAIEDQRIHRFILANVVSKLEQIDFAALGGQFLDILTQGGRHQQLLNEAMHQLRVMLDDESAQDKVAKFIAKEFEGWRKYLLNVVAVDEKIGSFSAKKLIHAVSRLLDEVDEDLGHPLRARFDTFVAEFIVKLKIDTAFRSKGEEIRDQILRQPELSAYLRDLWLQLRIWLELDLNSPQSSIAGRIVAATLWASARNCATTKRRNPGLMNRFSRQLYRYVRKIAKGSEHSSPIRYVVGTSVT